MNLADLLVKPSHSISTLTGCQRSRDVKLRQPPPLYVSTFSLFAVKQSHGCLERLGDASSILSPQLNADGFGVSWYDRTSADPCIPAVYTSTSPAWNDSNLFKIGEDLTA